MSGGELGFWRFDRYKREKRLVAALRMKRGAQDAQAAAQASFLQC